MNNEIEDIHEFLSVFSKKYENNTTGQKDVEVLRQSILSPSECMYVLDFSMNDMSFRRGFKDFLGYTDESISLVNYMDLIHPEDIDMVSRIGKAAILHTSSHSKENTDSVLYLSFRVQKNDGHYIKVLSQSSVFETNVDGQMISSLVKVSDISFMEDNTLVKYNYVAPNLDQKIFKREIYPENHDLFTRRELEIIKEICNGATNEQISNSLQISKHTVAAHRKKILKKSSTHSADELIFFCRKYGVI